MTDKSESREQALREALHEIAMMAESLCEPSAITEKARAALSAPTGDAAPSPIVGRLIEAYTPTIYDGHLHGRPPPYINFSEANTPYEEAVITVRSPCKGDGAAGDSAFIVITNYELRRLLLRVARHQGWLPMTEDQWLRDYYSSHPEENMKRQARIRELTKKRDEALRTVEETNAELADIPELS